MVHQGRSTSRAEGFLTVEPVRARIALNPDLISTGVTFHF
jgi:hypothetical protein